MYGFIHGGGVQVNIRMGALCMCVCMNRMQAGRQHGGGSVELTNWDLRRGPQWLSRFPHISELCD